MGVRTKLSHAWNAFTSQDEAPTFNYSTNVTYSGRPDRFRAFVTNERTIITAIMLTISNDAANLIIRHCRVDDQDRFLEAVPSGLDNCLTIEANLDQAGRAFRQDLFLTLLDHGVAAIVPVDTTLDPAISGGFDIKTLRVGHIKEWAPQKVKVSVYNEKSGRREDVILDKKFVAIVENPFYTIMNEPNSTLQRLLHKLSLLDVVDQQNSSGKLDLIIQLPYVIKSEARKEQAEARRVDIENQLSGSKYGIAYTDGTEKITQLNRPVENTLLTQVEFLTKMLYGQLGLTEEVMNGTADQKVMINYYNRTVEPLITAAVESMKRTFLTKTARSQKQSIMFFRDPFKLVPIADVAAVADIFARNEIATSNEIRQAIGWTPSKDPKADQLVNSNMPAPTEQVVADPTQYQEGASQNGTGF